MDDETMDPDEGPSPRNRAITPLGRTLEASRFLVALGALTAVLLAGLCFLWSMVKVRTFVELLLDGASADDQALVKLFETVDVILIANVLLIIGVGLWELFVSDLDLPPALTTSSFDDLKAKIATTLVLVLVVQFLETFVQRPGSDQLIELGASVALVGALLVVFARWRGTRRP